MGNGSPKTLAIIHFALGLSNSSKDEESRETEEVFRDHQCQAEGQEICTPVNTIFFSIILSGSTLLKEPKEATAGPAPPVLFKTING
jgi:hypothetical protein